MIPLSPPTLGPPSTAGRDERPSRPEEGALRLFLAIYPDGPTSIDLDGLCDRLAIIRGVRWTRARDLHVTLRFLAGVALDRVPPLLDACRRVAAAVPAFSLALSALATFPAGARPRVIWLGIDPGGPELALLAARVSRELEPLDFPAENRPFKAHLTLGRVRDRLDRRSARDLAAIAAKLPEWRTFPVDRFVLLRSTLGPRGALHEPLESFDLGGRP